MTTFDERENAYESKFAHDEDLRFKAKARRDKAFGAWAAMQLGLSGAEAEDYAKEVLRSEFKEAGSVDVAGKVLGDFRAKSIPMDESTLRKKLIELMAQAVTDIESGK